MKELDMNISVACFKNDGSETMIGVSILFIAKRSPVNAYNKIIGFNVFKEYKVDKFLASNGMVVAPNYRGRNRGIGMQLLAVRGPICKENGLTLTSSIFTSMQSDKLAMDLGFVENARKT